MHAPPRIVQNKSPEPGSDADGSRSGCVACIAEDSIERPGCVSAGLRARSLSRHTRYAGTHGALPMQADEFERALKEELAQQGAAPLWYPGSDQRYRDFVEAHPGCDFIHSTVAEGRRYSEALPLVQQPC